MVAQEALLRGVDLAAGPTGGKTWPPPALPPTLLQRTDQDFLAAVLRGLTSADGWQSLAQTQVAAASSGVLRLFQPVHRTFHLAVLELVCERPGQPRLDPQRIDSAGLVVRRAAPAAAPRQGWMRDRNQVVGWVPFLNTEQENLDPEPARRRGALAALHPELLARVPIKDSPWNRYAESVAPLFVAPPQVCQAVGRTLLYGTVPVTSSEQSEGRAPAQYDLEFIKSHLPALLQPSRKTLGGLPIRQALPRPGRELTRADSQAPDLQGFIEMLKQLLVELNVFDETRAATPTPGQALYEKIDQLQLPFTDRHTNEVAYKSAGPVLRDAVMVLVNRNKDQSAGALSVTMPDYWPAIDDDLGQQIAQAAKTAMDARFSIVAPQQGRFEEADPAQPTTYRVRAFVRLRRPDGCPAEILWSEESAPFTIVPWFDNGALPPVKVPLPPVDRNWVKTVKPNVAFQVPGKLFEFLRRNDPLNLLKGEGEEGRDLGLNWICGFNIPLITICAFIVLFIFLVLLNIVFFWLPFIKICIPLPSKKGGS